MVIYIFIICALKKFVINCKICVHQVVKEVVVICIFVRHQKEFVLTLKM